LIASGSNDAEEFTVEGSSDILAGLGLEPLGLSPADLAEVQYCLEVAAILEPGIDLDELRYICEIRGLSRCDGLITRIAERSLIEREDGTWAFPDDAMRQQLIEEAERKGCSKSQHLACARALFSLYPEETMGVDARRVAHLCAAGSYEEALRPILGAIKEVFSCGDFDKACEYLDLRDELLDKLGIAADSPSRAQNTWRRAWLHHTMGELEVATKLAAQSREVLGSTDWAEERGHAALLHGRIYRDAGEFANAKCSLDEAVSHFASAGDNHGLAKSCASRGYVELQTGDYRQARRSFSRALVAFEALEDCFMVASLLNFIAQTWLVDGNDEEARLCVERARRVAREAGHKPNEAGAWIVHGEMARNVRDWEEARRCYSAAARLFEEIDSRSVHITYFNLALVEVGARSFGAAMNLFQELEHCYPEVGFSSKLPLVYVGMMTCAAGVADWQAFERHHARTLAAVDEYETSHADIAWMAKEAMALAEMHGNVSASGACAALACGQFAKLGQHDQAEKLNASLA
jgi:tetratricopeptide (TPR) repeat protein